MNRGTSLIRKRTPLGLSQGPRPSLTVESLEGAFSYERGTLYGSRHDRLTGCQHLQVLTFATFAR